MNQQDGHSMLDFQLLDCSIYPTLNVIKRANTEQHIEPKSMLVLLALADSPNTVLTREQIVEQVWANSFSGNESLSRCISLLRSSLGESKDGNKFIETIPKIGYRLVAPIEDLISNEATQVNEKNKRTLITKWLLLSLLITISISAYYLYRSEPLISDNKVTDTNAALSNNSQVVKATSIAVLPFLNMSSDKEQEYFSDGLTEEILNVLVNIPELRVISRTSSFSFKNTNIILSDIAKKLNVQNILKGSIRKDGNSIRITVQLIDTKTDSHIWSQTYDRKIEDIFAVQDDIAADVASSLKIRIVNQITRRNHDVDFKSYEKLLKAKEAIREASVQGLTTAKFLLDDIIKVEPNYAEAYATLSKYYNTMNETGSSLITEKSAQLAVIAANKAINLSPKLAAGYVELGIAYSNNYSYSVNYNLAFDAFNKAKVLNANDSETMLNTALLYQSQNKLQEALVLLKKVLLDDPINSRPRSLMARLYLALGNYEAANLQFLKALEINNKNSRLLMEYAHAQNTHGNLVKSVYYWRQFIKFYPTKLIGLQELTILYMDLNDLPTAESYLKQAETIAAERVSDERAMYCVLINNNNCVKSAVERMILERDASFVASWKAKLEYKNGDAESALNTMKKLLADSESTNTYPYIIDSLQHILLIYSLEDKNKDEAELLLKRLLEIIEPNFWNWEGALQYAGTYAAIGDAKQSAHYLELAYQNGFRNIHKVKSYWLFEQVMDAPEFQTVLKTIEKDNKQMLSTIRKSIASEN